MLKDNLRLKILFFYAICLIIPFICLQLLFVGYNYYLFQNRLNDLSKLDFTCVLKEKNPKKTVVFDPVRGFRLNEIPSRILRITKGEIEYVGKEKGNNQYFQDRDDWYPLNSNKNIARWAVFGDSFTAGPYLEMNWPDRVEDLVDNLILMNFSVDGGGLANWYNILIKIIEKENYDIDGIIFANFRGNLYRGFTIADHSDSDHYMFNRIGFNKLEWPSNRLDAQKFLTPSGYAYYVDPHLFNNILFKQKNWEYNLVKIRSSNKRDNSSVFKIKLAGLLDIYGVLVSTLRKYLPDKAKTAIREIQYSLIYGGSFSEKQLTMINEIKEFKTKRKIPIIVIDLPPKNQLLEKNFEPNVGTLDFLELVDADYYFNFPEIAYASASNDEINDNFFPYDGHWNQKGSDKFSNFIVDYVSEIMTMRKQ